MLNIPCIQQLGLTREFSNSTIHEKKYKQRATRTTHCRPIESSQFVFRRGSSCTGALITMRHLTERRTKEYDKELNIIFVDQENAPNKVDTNFLWERCQKIRRQRVIIMQYQYHSIKQKMSQRCKNNGWVDWRIWYKNRCTHGICAVTSAFQRIHGQNNISGTALN